MVVQPDRALDYRLQEIFLLTLQFAPHVLQHFVSIEETTAIEEFDAVLEFGGIHRVIVTRSEWRVLSSYRPNNG